MRRHLSVLMVAALFATGAAVLSAPSAVADATSCDSRVARWTTVGNRATVFGVGGTVCVIYSSVYGTSVSWVQSRRYDENVSHSQGYWNSAANQVTFWANLYWYPYFSPLGIYNSQEFPRLTYTLGKGWGCYLGSGGNHALTFPYCKLSYS
jgi:hypothetical protein